MPLSEDSTVSLRLINSAASGWWIRLPAVSAPHSPLQDSFWMSELCLGDSCCSPGTQSWWLLLQTLGTVRAPSSTLQVLIWSADLKDGRHLGPGFDHPLYSLRCRVTFPSVGQLVADLPARYSGLWSDSRTKSTCEYGFSHTLHTLHMQPPDSRGHDFWLVTSMHLAAISILPVSDSFPCSVWGHRAKWHLPGVPDGN